jgi:hypothetical protein
MHTHSRTHKHKHMHMHVPVIVLSRNEVNHGIAQLLAILMVKMMINRGIWGVFHLKYCTQCIMPLSRNLGDYVSRPFMDK